MLCSESTLQIQTHSQLGWFLIPYELKNKAKWEGDLFYNTCSQHQVNYRFTLPLPTPASQGKIHIPILWSFANPIYKVNSISNHNENKDHSRSRKMFSEGINRVAMKEKGLQSKFCNPLIYLVPGARIELAQPQGPSDFKSLIIYFHYFSQSHSSAHNLSKYHLTNRHLRIILTFMMTLCEGPYFTGKSGKIAVK